LVEAADKVCDTRERTPLLRVVNEGDQEKSRTKKNGQDAEASDPLF
jgi:hypothetical protein